LIASSEMSACSRAEASPAATSRAPTSLRPLEQALLFGVPVDPGDGAEPSSDRRPGAAPCFELASEALDVSASHREQAEVVLLAPGDELTQIERVRVAGQAAVAGEERRQRVPLDVRERRVDHSDIGRRGVGHVVPPGRAETGGQNRPAPAAS
jgi:hypothetical protein